MNRRGNLGDGPFIITNLFIMALGAFVALMVLRAFNDAIALLPGMDVAQSIMTEALVAAPQVFDLWFATFFIGAPLVSAVFAYVNNIPPFFFFLSIGYSLFQILLGKALELAYTAFVAAGDPATIAASVPMTNYILSNFGLYSYLVIVVVAIGTFAKIGVGRDEVGGI